MSSGGVSRRDDGVLERRSVMVNDAQPGGCAIVKVIGSGDESVAGEVIELNDSERRRLATGNSSASTAASSFRVSSSSSSRECFLG